MSILLDRDTRVMVQGLTGRQARTHTGYMQRYGTNVVCGVSPGHGGETVNHVPVYDSVAAALANHAVDMTVLFIPGVAVRDAAVEAIEAGVPHVHILAEGVPHHDAALVLEYAALRSVRVVGPNSQGIISVGKAKIGGTGGPDPTRLYTPGPVGILSRSGGMGGEIANALTHAGIGQSSYVAIGGDLLIGTGFVPFLELFEADADTRAVVLFGEAGGQHEEEAAAFIRKGGFTKPLVAMIVGDAVEHLPKGLSFGHTSSIVGGSGGEGSALEKRAVLQDAGAHVVAMLTEIPPLVAQLLDRQ